MTHVLAEYRLSGRTGRIDLECVSLVTPAGMKERIKPERPWRGLSFSAPAIDMERTNVDGIEVEVEIEVEPRRRLGLPAEVMQRIGIRPGDHALIRFTLAGRLDSAWAAGLMGQYSGAVPGLSAAADPAESPSE